MAKFGGDLLHNTSEVLNTELAQMSTHQSDSCHQQAPRSEYCTLWGHAVPYSLNVIHCHFIFRE